MAKKMTDSERQILKAAQRDSMNDISWFYEEVVKSREAYKDHKDIEATFKSINEKVEKMGICHARHVVEEALGWVKGPDTDRRNRYIKLTNIIAISNGYNHNDVHQLLLDATKKYLKEDFTHPSDAFLSKREQRNANKRRKTEKKYGQKREIKTPKTDDEKKEARKLRAAIRKKADELGIDRDEFKKGLETGKYKL